MRFPAFCIASLLVLAAVPAFAGKAVGDIHPEEAYPDDLPPLASPGPYAELIKQVQEKLHEHGFDAGPVNGQFGTKTQAALAQFQLAQTLPASGMLDDDTLRALDVQRPSGDGTVEASAESGDSAAGSTSGK
jgi:peptidoglycan hydrolase-like protein with peptidoglycan-binding domain